MAPNESSENLRNRLAEKMAGDITLSEKPGESLKKWRSNFEISQTDIANYLKVSPSVISDYESGRRKSPGTLIIKKIVESLLEIDMDRGSKKIHAYESILSSENSTKSIYSTYEYTFPIQLAKLVNLIEGEVIFKGVEKPLYGFSVIDSQRAILELSSHEFQKLYGWSTDRAMIFTKVSTGKSPMVAIRVTNLKPGAVVLHGLRKEEVEPGAVKMAEVDRIPLVATTMSIDQTVQLLKKYSQYYAGE
jgi:putative transcriptional regulator